MIEKPTPTRVGCRGYDLAPSARRLLKHRELLELGIRMSAAGPLMGDQHHLR